MQEIIDSRNKLLSALSSIFEDNYSFSPYMEKILVPIASNEDQFVGVSLDEPEKISYAKSAEDKFNPKTRIKTSFERYVRRQLEVDENFMSDYALNYLGRQLRIKLIPTELLEERIEILSGNQITDYYANTNITSCMTGSCWKTELYALNPDIISLVVYNKKARALLWTTEDYIKETESFQKILDRVYPENSEDSTMLRSWAERKGYVHRVNTGLCTDSEIELSNGKVYVFNLKHNNTFPYMDTFCYGDLSRNNIDVSNEEFNDCIILHETDGSYTGACKCFECGENISEEDAIYELDNPYCESCHSENFTTCSSCEEFIHNDDITQIRINRRTLYLCDHCLREDYVKCDSCDEYFDNNDAYFPEGGGTYCPDCYCDNFSTCFSCEEDCSKDSMIEFDKKLYCEDCAKEEITACEKCGKDILKEDSKQVEDKYYCNSCCEDIIQ